MISALLGPPRVPPSKYQSNRLRCFSSFGESVRTFLTSVVRTGFLCRASESSGESCGMRIIDVIRIPQLSPRSEEHTSELQSHSDLVCRLLLEKKKTEE